MPGVSDPTPDPGPARSTGFHLTSLLAIGVATGFAALLVGLTGDLVSFWPLYLVPIAIAAIVYYVAGALLSSAVVLLLVVLTAPQPVFESISSIAVGLVAAVVCGIIIGAQARRHAIHEHALEAASIRDQVTGVFKPEYLHARIAEEIRRCDRYAVSAGLVLVGIEDFAGFKDTFGAYKAGLLLEHMASVMSVCVRDTDVVARFGPEEFAAILPFATPAECRVVAARIRDGVRSAQFEGDALEPVTTCDVVVSFAAYPSEAATLEGLLELATQRLVIAHETRPMDRGPGPMLNAMPEAAPS
ncbi:MAG: GGDEF domain-containing protein [Coriobacteriia bacterium]